MGIFSRLFGEQKRETVKSESQEMITPLLKPDTRLLVYRDDKPFLSGEVKFNNQQGRIVIGPTVSHVTFPVCNAGTAVIIRGFDGENPFFYSGEVEESTERMCKITGIKRAEPGAARQAFRLSLQVPLTLYDRNDAVLGTSDVFQLIDISASGACFEGAFTTRAAVGSHIKIDVRLTPNSRPVTLPGTVVRMEQRNRKTRYAIRFEHMSAKMSDQLTRTLFNIEAERRRR